MKRYYIVASIAIAGAATFGATGHVAAWGNGCIDGIRFPDEQTYYAYLNTHPNAAVGVCTTTTTAAPTTVPVTTIQETTTSSTVSPSTTTAASTSSTTPETPSPVAAVVPPPESSPLPSAPNSVSCQQSDDGTTPSSDCDTPLTNGSPTPTPSAPTAPHSPSQTSTLPSTGRETTIELATAALLLGLGGAALTIARRKAQS